MHSYIISLIAVLSLNAHATVDVVDSPATTAPVVPRVELLCAEMLANPAAAGEPIKADEVNVLFEKIQARVTDVLDNSKHAPWRRDRLASNEPVTPEGVKDATAEAFDKAVATAGQAAEAVTDAAGQVAEKAAEVTAPIVDQVTEIVQKATDKITEVTVPAVEKTAEVAKDVADTAKDGADKAVEKAADVADAVAAKVDGPTVDQTTAKAADVAADAKATADAAGDKTANAAAKAKNFVGKSFDQIKDTAAKVTATTYNSTKDTSYAVRERSSKLMADLRQARISENDVISLNVFDKSDPEHGLDKAAALAQVDTLRYLHERLKDIRDGLSANDTAYVLQREATGVDAIKSYVDTIVNGSTEGETALATEFAALDTKTAIKEKVVADNEAAVDQAKAANGWRARFVERVTKAFGTVRASRPSQFAARNTTWLTSIGLGAGVFALNHYTGQTDTTTWVATVSAAGLPFVIFNKKIQDFAKNSFTTVKVFVRERILGQPAIKSATAWTSQRVETAQNWAQQRADEFRNWREARRQVEVIRATEQIKTFLSIRDQLNDDARTSRLIYNSFVVDVPFGTETTMNPLNPETVRELILAGLRAKQAGQEVRTQRLRLEVIVYRGPHTAQMVVLGSKLSKAKPSPADVMAAANVAL